MKKIIFLFLFLLQFFNLFASEYVEIKISKLHGLISFSESIMKTHYSLKSFQNIYIQKYGNNKLSQEKLFGLTKSYDYIKTARVYEYKKNINFYNMIKIESVVAENLDELKKISISYRNSVDEGSVNTYFEMLKYFLPIYEELIWNSNEQKLKLKGEEIKKAMDSADYDQLIVKAANFYGVKKNNIDKIYLALYPIPDGDKTLAFMLGNVESIGVLVNKPKSNITWLLSATIFHEIAHTIYDKNKEQIMSYFQNNKHASTQKVKNIFNESTATAIGAGWAFYEVSGGLHSNGKWYNNEEYDTFAKKIYPLVTKYISEKKSIDQSFIDSIVELY